MEQFFTSFGFVDKVEVSEMITLESRDLRLELDESSGAVRRVTDLKSNLVLAENSASQAFVLELEENEFTSEYKTFSCTASHGAAELKWELEGGIEVHAQVKEDGQGGLAFTANAQCGPEKRLHSLEYPLIDGLRSISGENDYVAHPFATGFLVKDPMESFAEEGSGFRYMPYPEGFSGATMQFFTYYAKGGAGLYFAAYDGAYHHKWLNFYKHGGALRASQIFGYEDVSPGKPVSAQWPFVIQTVGGDWYEACDRYREWALQQEWCRRGKVKDRADRPVWLLEETGAATFGINGMHDRSKWLKKYRQAVGAPIFHVTGPDWSRVPQTYGYGIPGGYEDWFPTCFSKENIETCKEQGDHFAPFEFDFLIATNKGDSENIQKNLQKWPAKPKSCDKYEFNMLCPICGYTHDLHVERDRRVVKESGADAMYYDISANNILKTCMDPSHGHPVGAGKEMSEAYRKIYQDTRDALSQDNGKYVPLGTEMINEIFQDVLDFYQARAFAQPCTSFESWPYRPLTQANRAWIIPMFHYVYSEYAPQRLDGWGKIVAEGGDLIYHTIAKTYLWGALFEINSEYSPMEVIDEEGENSSDEHYCKLVSRGFRFDEDIAAYLAKFAALRVGEYGKFLAYGRMLRPCEMECRSIYRTYFHYNQGEGASEQNSRGVILRESVIAQPYSLDGETAVFIANTTAFREKVRFEKPLIPNAKTYRVCRDYPAGKGSEEQVDAAQLLELELEPYQLMVVHAACE